MSVSLSSLRLLQLFRAANQMRALCHVTKTLSILDYNTLTSRYGTQLPLTRIQSRHYAKGRPKGSNKGKSTAMAGDDELEELLDIKQYRTDLETIVEAFKQDLIHNLMLKTNLGSYEKLQIKTNDGTFPLNQIASVVQKSPTIVLITLTRATKYMPDVMTALRTTLNLNPQQEAQSTIIVTITKVSREHREELSKKAKVMFNSAKDKLNKEFSKFNKQTSKANNEVLKKRAETQLLHEKNLAVKKAEDLMKAKITELTG